MYSQGLIGIDNQTEETDEFLAAFQARIDAEEKIEPNDPMPQAYRKMLREAGGVFDGLRFLEDAI